MLKRFIAIVVLIVLTLTCMPREAFCNDHHEDVPSTCQHHCSLTCHVHFNAEIQTPVFFQHRVLVLTLDNTSDLTYQNPIIARLKRPPIFSA